VSSARTKQQRFVTSSAVFTTSADGDAPVQEGCIPDKAAQAAAKKTATKGREKQQIALISECALDSVIVDEKSLRALKGSGSDFSALRTIEGALINQLGARALRQLCVNDKAEGCRNETTLLV
jgi:hypothetical protein